ncbi:MAG: thioesterase family protein [Planctomycetia bacterium]|nr:thioesterase family protein [Planctomycetia bacterium]
MMALTEHTMRLRVRYTECDPMGVVHHSRYFVYFELARTELYKLNGGNHREMEKEGVFFVVASVDCKYIKPLHYDDLIDVTVRVTRTTRAKIQHEYQIFRDGELMAVGHTTLAMISKEGKIILIPEKFHIGF